MSEDLKDLKRRLKSLMAQKPIDEKAIERARVRKDNQMVGILTEDMNKLDKTIAELRKRIAEAEAGNS